MPAKYTSFDVWYPSYSTPVRKQKVAVVYTPHVQERWKERVHTEIEHAFDLAWLRDVYFLATMGDTHAVPVVRERFLLYVRKIQNVKRHRHELECISLTPAEHVHTHKRTSAKLLDVSNMFNH